MHFLDKLFSSKKKNDEKPDVPSYDVFLMDCKAIAKVKVIQEIRLLKKLELKEAKTLVESAPVVIASGLPMNDALDIKFRFEKAGAEMKVQPTSTK